MSKIRIHDREFVKSISREEIDKEIKRVAAQINHDYAGKRPLFLGVLNGSFMFVADLLKNIELECEISFVKLSSYQGTETTGQVREVIGLSESLEGRDVIILEDIVDTGHTMHKMMQSLKNSNPASVEIASLFVKPARMQVPVDVKYALFTIPDRFIVGYGLDYDELYRNLPYIGILKRSVYE
jgi:hypoxanthine phosphoribosyltransferase